MSHIRRLALAIAIVALGSGSAFASTYDFSGTLGNGGIVSGSITGSPNNITAFTFYLPTSFPNAPPNFEMDQTNTFIGYIGPTYFQFEEDAGGYADILNLQFSGLPGTLEFSSLIQYPDIYGAEADYEELFQTGSIELPTTTPLPATLPLFAGGLGFVGYLARRRKKHGTNAPAVA
jgi:hypothetical protein